MTKFKKLALILFIASLFLPAFETNGVAGGFNLGIACLLFGWITFPKLTFFAWLSNFGFFYLLVLGGRGFKKHVIVGFLSVVLSLFSFFITKIPVSSQPKILEARVSWGFYLWLLSIILLLVQELRALKEQKRIN